MSAPARRVQAGCRRAPVRLVKQGRRAAPRRVQRGLAALLAGGIVAGALVSLVLLEQVVLAQSAFRLARVRAELARAEQRHEELLLEAARLESPDRIERVARRELGMTDARGLDYILADVHIPPGARLAREPAGGTSVVGGAAAGDTSGAAEAGGW